MIKMHIIYISRHKILDEVVSFVYTLYKDLYYLNSKDDIKVYRIDSRQDWREIKSIVEMYMGMYDISMILMTGPLEQILYLSNRLSKKVPIYKVVGEINKKIKLKDKTKKLTRLHYFETINKYNIETMRLFKDGGSTIKTYGSDPPKIN